MACIYHPDRANVAHTVDIPIEDGAHCWHVVLWSNPDALQREMACRVDGCDRRTVGLTCPAPYTILPDGTRRLPRILGEMHFARGTWDTEVVAHEAMHATVNFILCNGLENDMAETEQQERLCYMHGKLFDALYRFLWKNDPVKKVRR